MTWIQTRSGRVFDVADPWASEVSIADICFALARIARFTGHTRRFYSVGEHTLGMLRLWSRDDRSRNDPRFEVLVRGCVITHDMHEAYVGDMSRPVKRAMGDAWLTLEHNVMRRVQCALGTATLDGRAWGVCKDLDNLMLALEATELMQWPESAWTSLGDAFDRVRGMRLHRADREPGASEIEERLLSEFDRWQRDYESSIGELVQVAGRPAHDERGA